MRWEQDRDVPIYAAVDEFRSLDPLAARSSPFISACMHPSPSLKCAEITGI